MTEIQSTKKENLLLNIGFNLILPILFLRKGTDWIGEPIANYLGTAPESTMVESLMLVIAISFPVGYGTWDLIRRRKWNVISILGALSALLTGGIGLIPGATVKMFAIKEAALPTILGALTVLTLKTKRPLVHLFLLNPEIMNVDLINQRLKDHNAVGSFDALMKKCTWLIALSFIVSAFLNYFLSRWIVVTEPFVDKIAFNDQVGQMMGWSFPVISIPCMLITLYALKILTSGIKEMTGLKLEETMAHSQAFQK